MSAKPVRGWLCQETAYKVLRYYLYNSVYICFLIKSAFATSAALSTTSGPTTLCMVLREQFMMAFILVLRPLSQKLVKVCLRDRWNVC
jgi:hypothetical protein